MGVLARVFEAAGLSTTSLSMVREHTEKVKPPRALWVPFPFGRPLGKPDDAAFQHRVLRAALDLLQRPSAPVLEVFSEGQAEAEAEGVSLPQASGVQPKPLPASRDVAFEVTSLRPYYEQWVRTHEGRTGVGLCAVGQRRFRGLVRFLESFAADGTLELPSDAPAGAQPYPFMRAAADDLKTFYLEARLAQKPDSTMQQINTWLWSETALADLLRAVRDRLKAASDPKLEAVAFGIAR